MNCKHFYAKLIICLLLLTSCSKSEDLSVDLQINNFVWKGLNAYYLWQSDVPDLQDRRFGNQSQLNSYLSGFSSPESLFENLLNRPEDRFSVIVDDYIALENSFQGIFLSTGMEFGLVLYANNDTNVFGYVRYVIPNSPADLAGITRGMIFNHIDGTQITVNNFRNLVFGSNTTVSFEFADYNNGDPIRNGTIETISKVEVQENPIAISKVISTGTQKIGYLLYNQFASNYNDALNAAFGNFKSENIDELIVDLRYNGGGSTNTATLLGSLITGQFSGELYSQEIWNEKVMNAFSPDNFTNNFINTLNNAPINSLNLPRVYFIVSGSTASASELVINALRAYIDVRLVGTQTVGKQVGSITLYDSGNFFRTGSVVNPNHTYAMQPIVLEISNKNKENVPLGFIPGSTLPGVILREDFGNLGVLGERSDPLLDRTIVYIETGSKGLSNQKSDLSKEFYNSKLATPTSNNMYTDLPKNSN